MKASELLRSTRRAAGISQDELARRLKTKQPVIARWETDVRSPSFETVLRAIEACGFEVNLTLHPSDLGETALLQQWQKLTPVERLRRNEEMLDLERWAQDLRFVQGENL